MKILAFSLLSTTINILNAIPLCPTYKKTFYDAHDGVLNTKQELKNSFFNRLWNRPILNQKQPTYNSVYEKYFVKASNYGWQDQPEMLNNGVGTIDEFEDQEKFGPEVLNWLDCRTKVVPLNPNVWAANGKIPVTREKWKGLKTKSDEISVAEAENFIDKFLGDSLAAMDLAKNAEVEGEKEKEREELEFLEEAAKQINLDNYDIIEPIED